MQWLLRAAYCLALYRRQPASAERSSRFFSPLAAPPSHASRLEASRTRSGLVSPTAWTELAIPEFIGSAARHRSSSSSTWHCTNLAVQRTTTSPTTPLDSIFGTRGPSRPPHAAATTDLLLSASPAGPLHSAYLLPDWPPAVVTFAPLLSFAAAGDSPAATDADCMTTFASLPAADLAPQLATRKATSTSASASPGSASGKSKKRALGNAISNEEKQAKNRLFVKRCYYKKRVCSPACLASLDRIVRDDSPSFLVPAIQQEMLKSMRDEVAELELEFANVFGNWQAKNAGAPAAFQRGERQISMRDLYAELTLVRSSLLEEQQQLKLRLAERFHFRQRLLQLYEPAA